jgi:hypothetical protein
MIIALIGSARFASTYEVWADVLRRRPDYTVFSLASMRPSPTTLEGKIIASDAVLVLNVFAYLGKDTLAEIALALKIRDEGRLAARKLASPPEPEPSHPQLFFLESWGEGLGVGGPNYNARLRQAALGLGIPKGYTSPFPASSYPGPWDRASGIDLFGPAGDERNRMVKQIEVAREAMIDAAASTKPTSGRSREPVTPPSEVRKKPEVGEKPKTKKIKLVVVTHKRHNIDYEFDETVLTFFCDVLDLWHFFNRSKSTTTVTFGDSLERDVKKLVPQIEHLFAAFAYRHLKIVVKEVEVYLDGDEIASGADGYPIFVTKKSK